MLGYQSPRRGVRHKSAKNCDFFADLRQFSASNSAVPQQTILKFSPHITTISPNNLLKFQSDQPMCGRATSWAIRRKSAENHDFFPDFRQFWVSNSTVHQPALLKLAPHIATISPNNPLKFQPDRPRWVRAATRAVRRKSAKITIFLPIVGSFQPLTRPYPNQPC